jgi:CDP-diacylglycerol--glycerol-3-phosphate 3-phosphatidyltransferase
MISEYGRRFFAEPVRRIAVWLYSIGATPNIITLIGFALTVVSAIILGSGYFVAGALVLWLAAMFDMLDGALARHAGQISAFGAFLDSTLDRYSESVTLLALAFHYSAATGTRTELMLTFVILVGSLMVSYARARAEALHIECKEGILQRPERLVLLIAGLLFGWMLPVLWILAVFTNFTAIQRIYSVYVKTVHEEAVRRASQPNRKTPVNAVNAQVATKDESPAQG